MARHYYLDESGDPELEGTEGSSSHFALAMVRLAERSQLLELAIARKALHLSPVFEFKYYKMTPAQKKVFFDSIQALPFSVRAVVVDKTASRPQFAGMGGQDFTIELVTRLILRASVVEIADDVLIVDGATPAFLRALRIKFTRECHRMGRVRPFEKIVEGDSRREDGLQLADMVASAVRHYVMGDERSYCQMFASKIADLWEVSGRRE